jgi:hypothetical protein
MLTLHTTRDPVVPLFHQTLYGSLAPEQWLVQRTVNAFGHCQCNQQEMLTAFDDLVLWVNDGVRPAGGDATIRQHPWAVPIGIRPAVIECAEE